MSHRILKYGVANIISKWMTPDGESKHINDVADLIVNDLEVDFEALKEIILNNADESSSINYGDLEEALKEKKPIMIKKETSDEQRTAC